MDSIINGKPVEFSAGEKILQVARRYGQFIPTLCEMHDIDHAPGNCRVCLVETRRHGESRPRFAAACHTPMQQGVEVWTRTPKVQEMRRVQVELLLADHHADCAACTRAANCELLDLAHAVGVKRQSFSRAPVAFDPVQSQHAVVYDESRCVRCLRCVTVCREVQGVDALSLTGRSFDSTMSRLAERDFESSECISCGQCVTVCPTAAQSERDDTQKVLDFLADPEIFTVFQIAPAVRVGFSGEFDLPPQANIEGKIVTALHRIGADLVVDTNFAADLVIMEEGNEVLHRLQHKAGPTFTSCCPGWINYAEKHLPELLPMISSTRSPQQCLGSIVKHYLAEKLGHAKHGVRVVSVMPCTAKKDEAAREEFKRDGIADVDVALTIREFVRLLRREGVDLEHLEESAFDAPFSEYSGAGAIFGTTGGVMEAALRTLYFAVNGQELEAIEIAAVRGMHNVRAAEVAVGGELGSLKVAICHGLKAARRLGEAILRGEEHYDFIEVMACPGGCMSGGGHLRSKKRFIPQAADRQHALYGIDRNSRIRQSHHNRQVQQLYAEFLGKPLSPLAHRLLHTGYRDRSTPPGKPPAARD